MRRSTLATCVALGLLLALSLAARVTDRARSDLHPWPDGPEYAATARGLLERGRFEIPFAGRWVPPGHGFGFPLLITPFLAVLGHDLANALYATLTLHVLELLLVFLLAGRCYGRAAGLLAVAFVAASPVEAELSRRIMSEVPGAAVFTGGLVLLCRSEPGARRGRLFAVGFVLASACWIRYVDALLVTAVALVVILYPAEGESRAERALWLLAGVVSGAVPIAAYNVLTLGSLTRMPHSIWVPAHKTFFGAFGVQHALEDGKAFRYLAALLGNPDDCLATVQPLYAVFVPALAIAAPFVGRRRESTTAAAATVERVAALVVAVTLAVCSFYFFETELRLLFAVVPILCVVSAGTAVRLFTPLLAAVGSRPARVALCAAALSWPGLALARNVLHGPLAQQLVYGREPVPAVARDHLRLVDRVTESDAWVLSDRFEPVFFSVEERGGRRLLQIEADRVAADDVAVETLADVPQRLPELLARRAHVYFVGDPAAAQAGALRACTLTPVARRTYFHGWITLEVHRVAARPGATIGRVDAAAGATPRGSR